MCDFILSVEKANFHPGGTALRGEAMTPSDRCALKPKKDNFGRKHDPIRWVMSGGSPITVAHPCSAACPLKVPAEIGGYGSSFTGPCPVCHRIGKRADAGYVTCRECGTGFELIDNT
jgi:hypothetical protein